MKSFQNIRNDVAARLGLKAKSKKWWMDGPTSHGFGVVVSGPDVWARGETSMEVYLPQGDFAVLADRFDW